MENLAYLYVLAEEAESEALSSVPITPKPLQFNVSSQSVLPLSHQIAQTQKTVIDDDREPQSYPTFYL